MTPLAVIATAVISITEDAVIEDALIMRCVLRGPARLDTQGGYRIERNQFDACLSSEALPTLLLVRCEVYECSFHEFDISALFAGRRMFVIGP